MLCNVMGYLLYTSVDYFAWISLLIYSLQGKDLRWVLQLCLNQLKQSAWRQL